MTHATELTAVHAWPYKECPPSFFEKFFAHDPIKGKVLVVDQYNNYYRVFDVRFFTDGRIQVYIEPLEKKEWDWR